MSDDEGVAYGFLIDLDSFTINGNNREFKVTISSPEGVQKFIDDNQLFKDQE